MDPCCVLYHFVYPVPPRDGERRLFLHQLRDESGFLYLRESFLAENIPTRFGGIIRNVSEGGSPPDLGPTAIVGSTTRFPLDDQDGVHHRVIRRSDTELEQAIFAVTRVFFSSLHRRQAVLSPAVASLLTTADSHFANTLFNTHHGACCMRYICRNGQVRDHEGPPKTLAYFLNLPSALPCGAGLLFSWGMGGEQTLFWNALLLRRYSRLLTSPVFAVVEFDSLDKYSGGGGGPTRIDDVELNERIVLEANSTEIFQAATGSRVVG